MGICTDAYIGTPLSIVSASGRLERAGTGCKVGASKSQRKRFWSYFLCLS